MVGQITSAKVKTRRCRIAVDSFVVCEPEFKRCDTPERVIEYARACQGYDALAQEWFAVVCLNSKNDAIAMHVVTVGTATATLVHPREVFRHAIADGACGALFVHNHPSGNARPSGQDRELTQRLVDGGKLLGIRIVDHVIIGACKARPLTRDETSDPHREADAEFFSFCSAGLL